MATQKSKKLEMVPASGLAVSTPAALTTAELPKGLKKLTLPPLVKPEQVPIGGILSGEIVGLVNSISSRPDMRESKLLHLAHETGQEFLFPLTGTIKKALGGNEGVEKAVGQTLFLQRTADGETEKYGGKKKVYMFDVYLKE